MTNLKDALHIPDTQSARDERHLAIQRPWYSSRLSTPETGARLRRKNGKAASMRPSLACSRASMAASWRFSAGASSGSSSASSQATKRDMCVPLTSAGKATSRLHSATVASVLPPIASVSG